MNKKSEIPVKTIISETTKQIEFIKEVTIGISDDIFLIILDELFSK